MQDTISVASRLTYGLQGWTGYFDPTAKFFGAKSHMEALEKRGLRRGRRGWETAGAGGTGICIL